MYTINFKNDLDPKYIHSKNDRLKIYCDSYETFLGDNGIRCYQFNNVLYYKCYHSYYVKTDCYQKKYVISNSCDVYLTKLEELVYYEPNNNPQIETIFEFEPPKFEDGKYESEYLEDVKNLYSEILKEIELKNLQIQNNRQKLQNSQTNPWWKFWK